MQELGPNQLKWIEALESGKYEQGSMYLNKDNKFCCLGIACELFDAEKGELRPDGAQLYGSHGKAGLPPNNVVIALALNDDEGNPAGNSYISLVKLNDGNPGNDRDEPLPQHSFKEIAAIVRANPGDFFREAR